MATLAVGCGGEGGGGSATSRTGGAAGNRQRTVAVGDTAAVPSTALPFSSTTTAAGPVVGPAERADGPARPIDRLPASNPWTDPRTDAASTFGLDVDTGSYALARNSLGQGRLPVPDTVRTEEFV
ncbi:MAG TPA: von Willebrand factor type A domain-containing protein, partial [Acidimicrobiales bacterium]|nr:von Willebrand factor type A domain-containing protein [Acidimicrobiales bacterium]